MTREHGTMDFDYRKRCVRDMEVDGVPCVVIRYGMTADEANGSFNTCFYDESTSYADLSVGGRRSGNPIEEEWKLRRHYFNKRIVTSEEKLGLEAVQGNRNVGVVGALYGEGGAGGVEIIEASEGGAWGGDLGDGKSEEGNSEEVI